MEEPVADLGLHSPAISLLSLPVRFSLASRTPVRFLN
jgi:hypothetical protein